MRIAGGEDEKVEMECNFWVPETVRQVNCRVRSTFEISQKKRKMELEFSCRDAHIDADKVICFVHHSTILCASSKRSASRFNWYRRRALFTQAPTINDKYVISMKKFQK